MPRNTRKSRMASAPTSKSPGRPAPMSVPSPASSCVGEFVSIAKPPVGFRDNGNTDESICLKHICASDVLRFFRELVELAQGPYAPSGQLIFKVARLERALELTSLHGFLRFGFKQAG